MTMARKVTGTLFKRGPTYWCKFKHRGRDYRFSLKTTKEPHARHELDRLMLLRRAAIEDRTFTEKYGPKGALVPIQQGKLPLASAWQCYISSVNRPDTGKNTLLQYSYQFQQFIEWMSHRYPAIKHMSGISRDVAEEYAGHIRAGFAKGTYNKHLRLLTLVFRVLGSKAGMTGNPWRDITRLRDQPNNKRDLTDEELRRIFSMVKDEMLTVALIGYHTALRLGDACLLEWSEIRWPQRRISRIPLKTRRSIGKPVVIPMSDELHSHLQRILPPSPGKYVCPSLAKKYLRDASAVTDEFQTLLKDCGIRTQKEGTGADTGIRAVVEVGFHSFRHTWITRAAERGTDQASVCAIVGWGSPAMEKVYTHISPEHLDRAMSNQPSIAGFSSSPEREGVRAMPKAELLRTLAAVQGELKRRDEVTQDSARIEPSVPVAVPA